MSDTIRHPLRRASWCGAVAGLALAAGALPALAQSAAPAEEPAAAMEALHAELGAVKTKLEQALAEARAKADAALGLEKTRADLEALLAAARKETDAARAAVEKAQADASAKAASIATLEQARKDLETAVATGQSKLAAAEKAAGEQVAALEKAAAEKLAAAEKALGEKLALAERKATAANEAHEVAQRELAALTKKLATAETQAAKAENERAALAVKLDAALARLPARDGGTKTADQARARAADAGAAFVSASEQARKMPGDATKAALRDAGTALQQAQYDVAVATDARGVYRTREEDTLGMVAGRFYGTGNRWPAIYEANQHVLANPDRMLPGMTLVVP